MLNKEEISQQCARINQSFNELKARLPRNKDEIFRWFTSNLSLAMLLVKGTPSRAFTGGGSIPYKFEKVGDTVYWTAETYFDYKDKPGFEHTLDRMEYLFPGVQVLESHVSIKPPALVATLQFDLRDWPGVVEERIVNAASTVYLSAVPKEMMETAEAELSMLLTAFYPGITMNHLQIAKDLGAFENMETFKLWFADTYAKRGIKSLSPPTDFSHE